MDPTPIGYRLDMLIQCVECSELVAFDCCVCPSCGAEKVCTRGGVTPQAALLGITLASGVACSQPVYSAPATDSGLRPPTCDAVSLVFEGEISTISGTPLGLDDSARLEAVGGSMSYLPCARDSNREEVDRGEYPHPYGGNFELSTVGLTVAGSDKAIVTVENFDPDTFRFEDGNLLTETETRVMQVDGAEAPDLQLGFSITDSSGAALTSDAIPWPFPFDASMPHTFSLQDSGGTLLIQLDSISR